MRIVLGLVGLFMSLAPLFALLVGWLPIRDITHNAADAGIFGFTCYISVLGLWSSLRFIQRRQNA